MLDDNGILNSSIRNPDVTQCTTGKCTTLTIYYNNNNNHNSENNVDNNSNDNDHDFSFPDYYNSSVLTGSKPYSATKRNANDDVHSNGIHYCDRIIQKAESNNKSENNDDNNSYSNNNNPCADSEDNNDNNTDGNFISASTPPPSDSNADNAPPGRNNKNNVRPKFISHPNEIVFRVFKQKRKKNLAATNK